MEFGAACDCGDLEAVKACVVGGLVRASLNGHGGIVAFLLSCDGIDVNGTNVCVQRMHQIMYTRCCKSHCLPLLAAI